MPRGRRLSLKIHCFFEEALKLHLGLSQILGKPNSDNHATKAGRISAANLCIDPAGNAKITINEGRVKTGGE